MNAACSFPECKNQANARKLCFSHLSQAYKGRALTPLVRYQPRGTAEERFWRKVNKDGPVPPSRPELGPCWMWTGAVQEGGGYGMLWTSKRMRKAHRFSYEQANGLAPAGLELDHLCRVRLCVNPDHLEPVTHRENTIRGTGVTAANARKTHCKRGHAFTPENTISDQPGRRRCRTCRRKG